MSPYSQDTKAAFESMFEHASIGIVISNANGIIQKANPQANRLFGYEAGELIDQKIEVLIPTPLQKKHISHRQNYVEKPSPRSMGLGIDLSALRKDGSTFPVEISLAAYQTEHGRVVVSFINDITKRKKDEEALKNLNEELESKVEKRTEALSQAIQELQQMNENLSHEMTQRKKAEEEAKQAFEKEKILGELKSRFVSMASHEFRTPLSGILTSVSLIDRYNQAGDQEKINKHIQTIKSSVHSLTNILNDFLSLDKLDEGKVQCHPSSFSLVEFSNNLAKEIQPLAKDNRRIIYKHQTGKEVVYLDQELLRNILINLLSNALKYSFENSEIHFTTLSQENEVVITIQDLGIGIPEEEQEHLFTRFFRAHNAMMLPGTGLGLNIVMRYLSLMEGSIRYKSQQNIGTTFIVTLPKELKA